MSSDSQALAVAADWLAVCVDCGQEHAPRTDTSGWNQTWQAEDGHVYRPRVYVLTTSGHGERGIIEGLRAEAGRTT